MKKVLFTSLFLASAAMGLSSCMNGDYDATPEADTGKDNPLKTERAAHTAGTNDSTATTTAIKATAVKTDRHQ
jgi:hypothetical protein